MGDIVDVRLYIYSLCVSYDFPRPDVYDSEGGVDKISTSSIYVGKHETDSEFHAKKLFARWLCKLEAVGERSDKIAEIIARGLNGKIDIFIKNKQEIQCKCGRPLGRKNKTGKCQKCILDQSKCPKNRKELIKDLRRFGSNSAIARHYGVSESSVRRWLKRIE